MRLIGIYLCLFSFVLLSAQTKNERTTKQGYIGFARVSTGFIVEQPNYSQDKQLELTWSLETLHGYQFNPHFWLSAGAGFEIMTISTYRFGVPFLLNIGGHIVERKITPVYNVYGGYNIRFTNNSQFPFYYSDKKFIQGATAEAQIGLKIGQTERLKTRFMFGIKYQKFWQSTNSNGLDILPAPKINIADEYWQPNFSVELEF